jgi:ADP-heptose:LPS heptosyltransferase
MKRLLVIRTSAMGDVALTTPVIKGMVSRYPDVEIIMLTRSTFKPFFNNIEEIQLFTPDFGSRHKGFPGIFRLYRDISETGKIDHVIDLHDVLRSKIIRFLFRLSGSKIAVIDKGRREKRRLISGGKKVQLKHTVERYCDTFEKAGFHVRPSSDIWIIPSREALRKADEIMKGGPELNIGVAPCAKHKLKVWPKEKMIRLLEMISQKYHARFWLFGGKEDKETIDEIQRKVSGSISLVGKLNLDEELAVMSRLDVMIAMDSSNMHMAALTGTCVLSIWGGTDPLAGFAAWMQTDENSLRIPVEELWCRPCTIYGKGDCKRGDFACMQWLTPERAFSKVEKLIKASAGYSASQAGQSAEP